MIVFEMLNNKEFMNMILKDKIFDSFETRKVEIKTFTDFEISCNINKSYFTLDEQDSIDRKYCIWSEIKPYIFQLVKGNRQPSYMKIIFSYINTEDIDENAKALFFNMTFENKKILCYTGSSEKLFKLEKTVEIKWDEYIKQFLKQNNIDFFILNQNI